MSPDHKLLLCIIAPVVAIGLLAGLAAPPPAAAFPSSYSAASGGALAAFDLLAESGYPVQRWRQPPADLPRASAGAVLILADPFLADAASAGDRLALQRFVERGGRLLATGPLAASLLPPLAIPNPVAVPEWRAYPALLPGSLTRSAPRIELQPQLAWNASATAPFLPVYGETSAAVVISIPLGKGQILWWSSSTPLTNAGISQAGNLQLLLNSVRAGRAPSIFWDEYYHGDRAGAGAASAIAWKFALFPLALLALALLATYARRAGPLHEMPEAPPRDSPLEFAIHLGGLYERSRAAAAALELLAQPFRVAPQQRGRTAPDPALLRELAAGGISEARALHWAQQLQTPGEPL